MRALSIAETITGVILVSLVLTFLLGVYQVVSDLRALSAKFYSTEPGVGDAVGTLSPFFPQGRMTGLDGHLQGISDTLSSYTDGLRLHHAAYYFQSGRDEFSLPYAMRMMAGTIGALRWGLPPGHPATEEPVLRQLVHQFDEFREYLHPLLGWKSTDVPETVDYDDFVADMGRSQFPHPQDANYASRLWVLEFRQLDADMAALTHSDEHRDLANAYARYQAWLPFAYSARQAVAAISRDLDYQPIATTVRRLPGSTAQPSRLQILLPVPAVGPRPSENRWQGF